MEGENETVTETTEAGSATERNWDAEAREEGWVPQEQYKGSKPWIDAKTFVERGEQILPIVSAQNRKLKDELQGLRATTAQLVAVMNTNIAKERAEKDQYIRQLEDLKAKAIDEGKGQEVIQIDRQLANVRAEPAQLDPYIPQWKAENDWYGRDRRLTGIADGLGAQYRQDNPHASTRQILDYVTAEVKNLNGTTRKPASAEAPTNTTTVRKSAPKGKSWDDLPADVQTVGERFIKSMGAAKDKDGKPRMTKELYVKQYFGEEA